MSSLATRTARIPTLSRLGWLMALYAENHERLEQLFRPAGLRAGRYVSSVDDGLDPRWQTAGRRWRQDARRGGFGKEKALEVHVP